MVVLFLIMGLGYTAGKTKVMTIETNKYFSRLLNCITNPCNILYSALCTEHVLSNREVFTIMGLSAGTYLVLILIAQLVPLLLRVPQEQKGQYKFMMIFSNIGYMGIPVVSAIYGPEAIFEVAIFIMIFNIVLYTYGITLIRSDGGHKFQIRNLMTPMIFSTTIALICYLCNVRAPQVIAKTLDTVRVITTPLAMMIIGCALSSVPVKSVFSNWRLYLVAALKLLVLPILAYFVLRPIITNELVLGVMVTSVGMPIASNFTILSAQYDRDQKLASTSVFVTTLLSVATIPLLMRLLFAG